MISVCITVAAITKEYQVSNYMEGALWTPLGIVAAIQSFRVASNLRLDLIVLSLALVAFGTSDVVEAQTGAWWRPLWLLVWKGLCLVVMLTLLIRHIRRRIRR